MNSPRKSPFEVWLAIGEKARLPKIDYPPLRIVRFSGDALTFGIEEHKVEGVDVRVYSPAKTIAECRQSLSHVKGHAALPGGCCVTKDRPRNMSASVRERLMNLARQQKEPFDLVLIRYAQPVGLHCRIHRG